MGSWGTGPFDNDDSADWLADLEKSPRLWRVTAAVAKAARLGPKTFIDVTDGAEAISAAAVVAELLSTGKAKILSEETFGKLVRGIEKLTSDEQTILIRYARDAVATVSKAKKNELLDQQGSKAAKWKAELGRLQDQLKKSKPISKTSSVVSQKKVKTDRPKYRPGLIIAIPLPGRKFAYGKVFNNFDVGVYNFVSKALEPVETVVKHKFLYFNQVTDRAVKSGAFLVIGDAPFPDEESAWAPPMAEGVFPGEKDCETIHIVHKEDWEYVTYKQAKGMDIRTFSQNAELFVKEVVDRLVKGNNKKYRA